MISALSAFAMSRYRISKSELLRIQRELALRNMKLVDRLQKNVGLNESD